MGSLVGATGRAALGGGPEQAAGLAGSPIAPEARVLVRPGDTLWEIARAAVGPEGDPRPLVQLIREANGMSPWDTVLPGTSLVVPAS